MGVVVLVLSGCTPEPEIPKATVEKKCMSSAQLNAYGYDYLARVAKLIREDRKNMESFEGFINVMKGTVDNYSKMIKSSIYISNVVRFLPLPYAGEVSNSAKLISKTVLNLGYSASALNRYKKSSDAFLESFDKMDRSRIKASEVAQLAQYADTKVLADANDLRLYLKDISDATAAMSAATQGISDALDAGSGYMSQAKSFVGLSPDKTDQEKVAENRTSINARMAQLNQKIAALENSAETHRFNIAKARIYSELAMEIENGTK